MDYSINVKNQSIPDLIGWARNVNARNDAKAKESRDNMMNMLRMAGLAASMGGSKAPVAGNADAGGAYNDGSFNFSPQEQADLTMLGLNPNLMSKQQLRPNGNIWGNSFGAF